MNHQFVYRAIIPFPNCHNFRLSFKTKCPSLTMIYIKNRVGLQSNTIAIIWGNSLFTFLYAKFTLITSCTYDEFPLTDGNEESQTRQVNRIFDIIMSQPTKYNMYPWMQWNIKNNQQLKSKDDKKSSESKIKPKNHQKRERHRKNPNNAISNVQGHEHRCSSLALDLNVFVWYFGFQFRVNEIKMG